MTAADRIRPTRTELRLIREHAEKAARTSTVTLEMGIRRNVEDQTKTTWPNVLLVTNNPSDPTSDTDLADHAPWSSFTRGVQAAEGGRGIFDFYVYERGPYRDLITNVKAVFEGGRMVAIMEENRTLWVAQ